MKTSKRKRKLLLAAALSITALFGTAVGVMAQGKDGPPPRPVWVKADGSGVDLSKLPAQVPVVDAKGDTVRDATGKPKMVNPRAARTEQPTFDPGAAAAQGKKNGGGDGNGGHELGPDELKRP